MTFDQDPSTQYMRCRGVNSNSNQGNSVVGDKAGTMVRLSCCYSNTQGQLSCSDQEPESVAKFQVVVGCWIGWCLLDRDPIVSMKIPTCWRWLELLFKSRYPNWRLVAPTQLNYSKEGYWLGSNRDPALHSVVTKTLSVWFFPQIWLKLVHWLVVQLENWYNQQTGAKLIQKRLAKSNQLLGWRIGDEMAYAGEFHSDKS